MCIPTWHCCVGYHEKDMGFGWPAIGLWLVGVSGGGVTDSVLDKTFRRNQRGLEFGGFQPLSLGVFDGQGDTR